MAGASLKADAAKLAGVDVPNAEPIAIMPHRSINSFSAVEIKTYLGARGELDALKQQLHDDDGQLRNVLRVSLDVAGQNLICDIGINDLLNAPQISEADLAHISQSLATRLGAEARVLGVSQVDRVAEFLDKSIANNAFMPTAGENAFYYEVRDKNDGLSHVALRNDLSESELKQSQACGFEFKKLTPREVLSQAGKSVINIWSPVDRHSQGDLVRINGETVMAEKASEGEPGFAAAFEQDFYTRLDWENSELEHYLVRNFEKSSIFKVELVRPANGGIENTRVKIYQEFSDPLLTSSEAARGIEYEFTFGKANLAGRRGLLEIIPELRAARETLERLEGISQWSSLEDAHREISAFLKIVAECPVYSELKVSAVDYKSLKSVSPISTDPEPEKSSSEIQVEPNASDSAPVAEVSESTQTQEKQEQEELQRLGTKKVLASLEAFSVGMLDAMGEVATGIHSKEDDSIILVQAGHSKFIGTLTEQQQYLQTLKDELATATGQDIESIYYSLKEVAGRLQQDLALMLEFVREDLATLPKQNGFAELLNIIRRVDFPEVNLENFETLEVQAKEAPNSIKRYLKSWIAQVDRIIKANKTEGAEPSSPEKNYIDVAAEEIEVQPQPVASPQPRDLYDPNNAEQFAIHQQFSHYAQLFGDMLDATRAYPGSNAENWASFYNPKLHNIITELREFLADSSTVFKRALNVEESSGFHDVDQRTAQIEGERAQFLNLLEQFVTQAVSWSPDLAVVLGSEVRKLKENDRNLYYYSSPEGLSLTDEFETLLKALEEASTRIVPTQGLSAEGPLNPFLERLNREGLLVYGGAAEQVETPADDIEGLRDEQVLNLFQHGLDDDAARELDAESTDSQQSAVVEPTEQGEDLQQKFKQMTESLSELVVALNKLEASVPDILSPDSSEKFAIAFWMFRFTAQSILEHVQGIKPEEFSERPEEMNQRYQQYVTHFQDDLEALLDASTPILEGKKEFYGKPVVDFNSEESKYEFYWSMLASNIRCFLHEDVFRALTGSKNGLLAD